MRKIDTKLEMLILICNFSGQIKKKFIQFFWVSVMKQILQNVCDLYDVYVDHSFSLTCSDSYKLRGGKLENHLLWLEIDDYSYSDFEIR